MREYMVRIGDKDVFPCREDEFILAAMHRAGCRVISCGCYGGGCGVCKMRVASGKVSAVKRMSRAHVSTEEERQGMVLLCCVKPGSDVVLERVQDFKDRYGKDGKC